MIFLTQWFLTIYITITTHIQTMAINTITITIHTTTNTIMMMIIIILYNLSYLLQLTSQLVHKLLQI